MYESHAPSLRLLYDQPEPVGNLGRGTHHSVFRAVIWDEREKTTASRALFHDVAVVWDEDHDVRVLRVLEHVYLAGLLRPIAAIGERKGTLHVVLNREASLTSDGDDVLALRERLTDLATAREDTWPVSIALWNEPSEIIGASPSVISDYLRGIDASWQLGSKAALK